MSRLKRSVFMCAAGDPFVCLLSYKLFKERWYDEVDEFYVNYNNHEQVPGNVAGECLSRLADDPKTHIIFHPHGISNGPPIEEMTKLSNADVIMLLEEDGYIFSSGIVDECFSKIENGECDAVGSPRRSCGQEIWDVSQRKYNLDYSGYGDVGPNYWPNFFFCKRSDFLKTDLNFGSIHFNPGDYCKELDYTFKEENCGDTFVWFGMQLRAMGIRFHHVPQHHASPYEIAEKARKTMNWIGEPMKWIHAGSLSSGWFGYLTGMVPDVSHPAAKQEIESRVSFWTLVSDVIDGFDEFKVEYKKGIETLINNAGLDRGNINTKIQIYRELMNV